MKPSWTHLLRLEARLIFRRPEILVALPVFAALLTLVSVEGVHLLRQQLDTTAQVHAVEDRTLLAGAALSARLDAGQEVINRFRDPRDNANFVRLMLQTPIVKQPSVAFSLDSSQARLLPTYFSLNTGPSARIVTAYEYDNPQTFVLSRIDFSFVLVYLLPLFFLLAAHPIRTMEVQRGIAPLLEIASGASFAVYARRVLLACFPFFVLLVAAEAFTLAASSAVLDAGLRPGLVALLSATGSAALYATIWYGAVLVVIGRSRTPAASLVTLVAVWTVIVVLLPSLASVTAERLYPATPRAALIDEARRMNDELARQTPQLTRAYAVRHPEWHETVAGNMPVPSGATALIMSEAADQAMAPREQSMQQTTQAQLHVLRLFAVASPALATQMQMDRLAGNDLQRHLAFLRETQAAVAVLRGYFAPLLLSPSPGNANHFSQLAAFPRFAGPHGPFSRCLDGWDGLCFLVAVAGCVLALGNLRGGRQAASVNE